MTNSPSAWTRRAVAGMLGSRNRPRRDAAWGRVRSTARPRRGSLPQLRLSSCWRHRLRRRKCAATAVEPIMVLGIPLDFILFGLTLAGVAVFHHHTLAIALAGLAAVTALQARLHRVQVRHRPCRARAAHAARMGDPRQPVPAADGVCAAVAPLRGQPDSGRDAGRSCPMIGRAAWCCSFWCSCCRASSTTSRRR